MRATPVSPRRSEIGWSAPSHAACERDPHHNNDLLARSGVRPVDRIHSRAGSAPIGPTPPSAATAPIVRRPFPPRYRETRRAHGPTVVRGPPSCYICQRRSRGGRGGDADGEPDGIAGNGGAAQAGRSAWRTCASWSWRPGLRPVSSGGAGGLGDGPEPMGLKWLVAHGPFREDRRPLGRGRIDLARRDPARYLRLIRGPRSGGGPGRVGLLGMMGWRVSATALLLGFTMRESQVLGVDLATYRALGAGQEGLWREREASSPSGHPDNHRRRTRHGRRDEPAASVSGTGGAALLAVRPARRPGRRLVHGTTGRRVHAHPAIHPGRSGLRH